jgi:unsaturated chondroitin disaccharide hydrolase
MTLSDSTDDQLLNPKEMITAIELMFRRMDNIDDNCLNDFPLYSLGNTNVWCVSSGGSWIGGGWGGAGGCDPK